MAKGCSESGVRYEDGRQDHDTVKHCTVINIFQMLRVKPDFLRVFIFEQVVAQASIADDQTSEAVPVPEYP